MGGLAVLFLLGLYFVLTIFAVIRAKPLWAKGLVLLVALLIPTADAVYGRYKLKQMCKAEAGLKVYKVVHNVEGFMATSADESWIKQYSYQFSEGESSKGNYYRITLQNGEKVVEEHVAPKSKYRLRLEHTNERKTYRRSQYLIEDIGTGELLATDTQIGFNGGWAERLMAAFSDGGINPTWCTTSNVEKVIWDKRIVLNTLKHSGE